MSEYTVIRHGENIKYFNTFYSINNIKSLNLEGKITIYYYLETNEICIPYAMYHLRDNRVKSFLLL